jgi:hypothetical protein
VSSLSDKLSVSSINRSMVPSRFVRSSGFRGDSYLAVVSVSLREIISAVFEGAPQYTSTYSEVALTSTRRAGDLALNLPMSAFNTCVSRFHASLAEAKLRSCCCNVSGLNVSGAALRRSLSSSLSSIQFIGILCATAQMKEEK